MLVLYFIIFWKVKINVVTHKKTIVLYIKLQVDHMVCEGESLSSILHRFHESDFSFSQFEGLRVDSSEVIDEDTQFALTSSCSNTEATSSSVISCEPNVATIANKKKTNGFFLSLGSRRKSAPKRAPLS